MARPKKEPMVLLDESEDPFPDLDEQEGDGEQIVDELNDTSRVDLEEHLPRAIGAQVRNTDRPFGFDAGDQTSSITGRPTSPKVWANAHLHPSVVQLRVWRKINGIPHLVGLIDKDATEEEFIRFFLESMPKPGEGSAIFVVRPVDMNGDEVREEITLPPISEHHTVLRQVRAGFGAARAASGPDLSPVYGLQEKLLLRIEEGARYQSDRAIRSQEEMAKERVQLATSATRATEAYADKMLKHESERARENLGVITNVFSQLQTMQMQAATQEREASERRRREDDDRRERELREAERRAEKERNDYERRIERDRLEFEQKFAKESAEAERRERRDRDDRESRDRMADAERQRQHDRQLAEMQIAAQRDREHSERMMTLNSQRDKGESIEGLVERGSKLVSMFGIKPEELIEKFMGDKDDGGGTLAMLGEIIGPALVQGIQTLGEVVKAQNMAKARAQGPLMAPPMLPGPMLQHTPLQAQQPQYAHVAVAPDTEGGGQQPIEQEPPQPQGPQSSLSLPTQKAARVAIRQLARALKRLPEEQWTDEVRKALSAEFAIYHYCKDVSIRAALVEAGADEAFCDQFLSHPAVQALPDDVPRE